jgi:hypothetical protein
VSGEKSSLLTSYLALKRLLRKGRLEPTILNMMQDDRQGKSADSVAHALRECARNFLSYDARPIRIDPLQDDARMDADMRRLATRLLEHALSLQGSSPQGLSGFELAGAMANELTRYSEVSRNH